MNDGRFVVLWKQQDEDKSKIIKAKLMYHRARGPGSPIEEIGTFEFHLDAWTTFVGQNTHMTFERGVF